LNHEEHIKRALELASAGVGLVSPNPLVGCVIVSRDGEVAGEGTYTYDNVVHAEAIALSQAGERARGGTAYVSLEPHAHHGRTPPCTQLLIDAGIERVVCPMEDPNPLVSGRGFDALREAGIEVVTGTAQAEASRLNEKFICWHKKVRPFVHLKLAMSIDGRIALRKSVSTALSGADALTRVHELRHEYDAILVGSNTAVVDNPSLTDRSGKLRRRPLVRVVLDDQLRVSADSTLAVTANDSPVIVFTRSPDKAKKAVLREKGVEVVDLESSCRDLPAVLAELKLRDVQSILVEGGSTIAGAFVDAGLVDKVTFIQSPMIIGGGDAPVAIGGKGADSLERAMRLSDLTVTRHGADIEITGYPTKG
jgi:diaminohydroxyphosphoribosylaminopyrimidine deaminase / 5-amino-6-(5-phosphoribosylamino)uracil reductase